VAITAIEPLTKPELINRTYDVEFRSIFKKSGFMQSQLVEQLIKARGKILSGLFQLFAWEVLPDLQERRNETLWRIQSRHAGHAKQRVDSFLTLMVAILAALLKLLDPGKERTWEIVDWWIEYQGRLAEETERDTNLAVYLLDALGKEMLAKDADFRREYYLDFQRTVNETGEPVELSFVASSRDLLMAFQILSKNKGFKIPYASAQQLGVRLLNEQSVLAGAGWQCQKDKTVHGLRYYKLTKSMR
jgi:hypothetical protein